MKRRQGLTARVVIIFQQISVLPKSGISMSHDSVNFLLFLITGHRSLFAL
jgi:hypothetical protein